MRLVGEVEPDGRGRVTYDALVACLVRHGWRPEIQRRPSQRFATESVSRADFKPYALPMRVPGVSPEVKTTLPTSTLEMSPDRRRHSTTSQTSDSYRPWPLPPPLPESPYAVGAPSAIETTPSTCESPERLRNSFAAIHEGGPYRPWPIEPPSPGATSDSPYAVMEMPVAGSPSKLIHAEQQGLTIRQPQFEGLSITHSSYTAQPLPMRVAAPPRTDRATSPTPGMDADAGARFPTLRRSTTMDHFNRCSYPKAWAACCPPLACSSAAGRAAPTLSRSYPRAACRPRRASTLHDVVDEQGVMAFHLAAERPGSGRRLPLGTLELSTNRGRKGGRAPAHRRRAARAHGDGNYCGVWRPAARKSEQHDRQRRRRAWASAQDAGGRQGEHGSKVAMRSDDARVIWVSIAMLIANDRPLPSTRS